MTTHNAHRCSHCGHLDCTTENFSLLRAQCDCPWPEIDAPCNERVPGARNHNCPSLKDWGKEDISHLMWLDSRARVAERILYNRWCAWHFGVDIDDAGWFVPKPEQLETIMNYDYWPRGA